MHTACMLALLTAGACARDDTPARDALPRGGAAVIGGYVDIRTMNPFAAVTDLNKAILRYVLFTPLLQLDDALQPQPRLAEAWDSAAAPGDSLDVTFRLRRDVRWHDGRPTTAWDVARTFALARDPRAAYPDAAALAPHAREPVVLDSFTVRFRMRRHADFLEAFTLLPPVPAHVIGDVAPGDVARLPFGTAPVGNGPFRFARRTGGDWVFDADTLYSDALGGPPLLDRIVVRTIPEQTSLITELLTGRVDLAVSIRPAQVPQLQQSRDVRVITFPVPNWVFIALNTRLPVFAQRDVRRAIAFAIDRQALVDGIMGGFNVTGRASVTPVHWAFADDVATPFSLDSARTLLDRAGWLDRDGDGVRENPRGAPLRFRLKVWQGTGSYRELAEAIQAQLARAGIDARPEVVEFNTFLAQLQGQGGERRFEAAIGNWTDAALRKDDAQLLHSRFRDGPRQWTGFNTPVLDALLDSLAVVTSRDQARPLWRRYQQELLAQAPLVFLFYGHGINGVHARLQGVPDGDPRGPLGSVQRWHVGGRSRQEPRGS